MHVLVLIIQFPPDVNSSGRLMAQLCEGLQQRGHRVSVITAFPHYADFRIWDEYRGKLFQRDVYRDMDVIRLAVHAPGKKSMLHRLLSYLSFCIGATIAGLLWRQRYDVILCSNGSFFSGLAATIIGVVRRIPFIYNVQDLYPETPVQAGQLRNRLAIRVLERLEQFMYAQAAHVTVIAEGFRHHLLSKGVAPEKVSTIPNFVDTSFIRDLPKANHFSYRHGLDKKFVVTHAGNLGYVYDLETLLDAAELLRDEPRIVFLLVGDGVLRPVLRQRAAGLANVRFLPYQPQETLPLLRAASDVQLALYRSGSARYSMPSKVYEIMASKRPVLAGAEENTDLRKLIDWTRCGICVTPGDAHLLARAVLTLHADPAMCARMGQRGREAAERDHSCSAVVSQYDELCQAIVGHANARVTQRAGR